MLRAMFARATLLLLLTTATAAAAPMRVAVMDFTDAAAEGQFDNLGKGLQSMITTDLAAASAFELVERARLKDIQGELKLQRRSEIDPKTAVKIGKLAGASHLVSGSFTVLGDKMRIDCRLVAVDNGKVLLAEKVEGDKAAFFELEKTLVQKVVGSLGAKIAPKERAEMGKVHTADFDAFRKFSQGIVEFDEQKYDDALKSLREATAADPEFKLAQVTLAGYEDLVNKARASVTAARQTEDELARLKLDKETKLGADIADRLYQASKKGSKKEREVALLLLALTYDSVGGLNGPLKTLRERGDEFAQQRMSDNLYKAYWAGVVDAFPAVPVVPSYVRPPETLEKFDAEFARAVVETEKGVPEQSLGINFVYNGLGFGKKLHLDQKQTAAMLERAYTLALKLKPPADWKVKRQIELAEQFQQVLDLDRSTAYLLQAQEGTKDSETLAKVAEMLEKNRELTRVLQDGKRKDELRELLRATGTYSGLSSVKEAQKKFTSDTLTYEMAEPLVRHRGWPRYDDEYVIIGDEPAWGIDGNVALTTGPRSDKLRSSEIRYYRRRVDKREHGAMVVFGPAPIDRATVGFSVPFEPPADWQLAEKSEFGKYQQMTPEAKRPVVSLLFGLKNIKHDERPLEGYEVRIARDGVRLQKIAGASAKDRTISEQKIAEWPADLGGASKLDVSVALDGKEVRVDVNGKRFSGKLPGDANGFLGFELEGTGYAAIANLKVARP